MSQPCTLATPPPTAVKLSRSAIIRTQPPSIASRFITMSTNNQDHLDDLFKQKRVLRTKVRKALKSMDPALRAQEDNAIQSIVLAAPWFQSCRRLCGYISCGALREVDTSKVLDEILQSPLKVLQASDPVDLFLVPGLAFDISGRRLGRGGGYYDTFLKNYQELVKARNWKQPLLVALSYSPQILDEGVISVTQHDVSVDALVSPAGVIPISSAAINRLKL